ncbi:MAG: adenylyl-sulfate reductase subunit alpha [Chloroflexi bacterium]|nr:adenylyl-sulfate reductase subunit alpha [Chloroflexota bacterium]
MAEPKVEVVPCDILVVGGGMAGCGAAFEAGYWGEGLKVVMVEKAAVERSGAVAQGLSAINLYLGMRWGENTPEDYVRYVRTDLMGIVRDDLVYDVARHVDSAVHLFEQWGLPIWKTPEGRYVREGRWQIMINGESYKPIVAEATKKTLGEGCLYEHVAVSHLLTDSKNPHRIAGAVGFSVRENTIYVFKAKAVICAAGGATLLFKPRSVGEGMGRTWYAVFNTGSAYGLMIRAGAEMTQMENRFVASRFKDGYGPVGAWFLLFKSRATNAYGEDYTVTRADELKKFEPYGSAKPVPTPLRNHQMLLDIIEGKGPIYMRTEEAIAKLASNGDPKRLRELENEAWEDFLDMTITQAGLWAAQNTAPDQRPSEISLTEPYIMGSHAGCAGMWVSGPDDIAPSQYQWGYNRMTTVQGLFTAGDGAGASPHKFSSGSFTEGRLAAKAAAAYVRDHPEAPAVDEAALAAVTQEVWKPLTTFEAHKGASTREEVNPHYLLPKQGLLRLQKIMDEYAAGASTWYKTNGPMLERGLELLGMLKEDLASLGARDQHELLRCWELVHRVWTAEAHVRHMLFRKETRWPGYYYRADYPKLDDASWKLFVNSHFDPATGQWQFATKPYLQLVD